MDLLDNYSVTGCNDCDKFTVFNMDSGFDWTEDDPCVATFLDSHRPGNNLGRQEEEEQEEEGEDCG